MKRWLVITTFLAAGSSVYWLGLHPSNNWSLQPAKQAEVATDVLSASDLHMNRQSLVPRRYYGATWAVIIGVNDYPEYGSDQPELSACSESAQAVHQKLVQEFGFSPNRVEVLRDAAATASAIRAALTSLNSERGVAGDHAVLVYFAGHGVELGQVKSDSNRPGRSYSIAPADFREDEADTHLTFDELADLVDTVPCNSKSVLLDCCFSGAVPARFTNVAAPTDAVSSGEGDYSHWLADPSFAWFGSGGVKPQPLIVDRGLTVFSAAVIESLDERGHVSASASDVIPLGTVAKSVQDKVSLATNRSQSPLLHRMKDRNGEFVFRPSVARLTPSEREAHATYANSLLEVTRQIGRGETATAEKRLLATNPESRGWEWQWLYSKLQPTHLLAGHSNSIHTLQFHPDEPLLLSVAGTANDRYGRIAMIWNTDTGERVAILSSLHHDIMQACFVGKSAQAVFLDERGELQLWDWPGQETQILPFRPQERGRVLATLGNERHVAVGGSGAVWLYDVRTRQRVRTLSLHDGDTVTKLVSSSDGDWLCALARGRLVIWNVNRNSSPPELLRAPGEDSIIACSLSGSTVVFRTTSGAIFRHSLITGTTTLVFRDAETVGTALAMSPDTDAFAFGERASLSVWDRERRVNRHWGHRTPVTALAMNPQWIASGSENGTICLWKRRPDPLNLPERDREPVVAFDATGQRLLMSLARRRIAIADAADGTILGQHGLFGALQAADWSSARPQHVATADDEGFITVWDIATGQQVFDYCCAREKPMRFVRYINNDSQLLCGGDGGAIITLDALTGAVEGIVPRDVSDRTGSYAAVALWPTSAEVAVAVEGEFFLQLSEVQIWNTETETQRFWETSDGKRSGLYPRTTPYPRALSLHPDGRRLAVLYADTAARRAGERIVIWDTAYRTILHEVTSPGSPAHSLTFDPSGQRLLAIGAQLEIRDSSDWNTLPLLSRLSYSGHSVAFIPGTTRLAIAGEDGVTLLEPGRDADSTHLATTAATFAFNEEFQQIATGGFDGEVSLWNPVTQEQVSDFKAHDSPVWALEYSDDGTLLVTGDDDGTISLWSVPVYHRQSQWSISSDKYPGDSVTSLDIAKDDSNWIVAGTRRGRLVIVQAETNEPVQLADTGSRVTDIAIHDGCVAAVCESGEFLTCSAGSGTLLFRDHSSDVAGTAITFDATGTQLIVGRADGALQIHDRETGRGKQRIRLHNDKVTDVCVLSSDGQIVSSSLDRTIQYWTIGDERRDWGTPRRNRVTSIAVCQQTQRLMTLESVDRGGLVNIVTTPLPNSTADQLVEPDSASDPVTTE